MPSITNGRIEEKIFCLISVDWVFTEKRYSVHKFFKGDKTFPNRTEPLVDKGGNVKVVFIFATN